MDISSIKADTLLDSQNLIKMKKMIAEQIKISEQAASGKISGSTQRQLLNTAANKSILPKH
jgi:hypothetical protein